MNTLFAANPFSTPCGQQIESASSNEAQEDNWTVYLDICDIVNETDEGPKDCIRAIRKRISQLAGTRETTNLLNVLTILETCVKNCGHRFHVQVATKEFLQELIKLISSKNNTPIVIQERVLGLIQTWAEAFKASPDLIEVQRTYDELRSKGVEFPATNLDSMAPIHTPARLIIDAEPARAVEASERQQHHETSAIMQPVAMPPHRVASGLSLNQEQKAKLRSDLATVETNCRVLNEMLTELTPGQENADDYELLKELNLSCREMQLRVARLISQLSTEELIGDLLRINDELNNAFVRYDRYMRQRRQIVPTMSPGSERAMGGDVSPALPAASAAPAIPSRALKPATAAQPAAWQPPAAPASQPYAPSAADQHDLISLTDGLSVSQPPPSAFAAPPQRPAPNASANNTLHQTDEFDMFAQSRTSFEETRASRNREQNAQAYKNQVTSGDQLTGGLVSAVNSRTTHDSEEDPYTIDKPSNYAEMEKWLEANPASGAESGGAQAARTSQVSSSEFDRFLEERSLVAERSRGPAPGQAAGSAAPAVSNKDRDHEDDPMFAL